MDKIRIALFAALAVVSYMLLINWQKDYPPKIYTKETIVEQPKEIEEFSERNSLLPNLKDEVKPPPHEAELNKVAADNFYRTQQTINVKTDLLDVAIDLEHGNVVNAKLLNYPVSVENKSTPITILQDNTNQPYTANSSLIVKAGNRIKNEVFSYTSNQKNYILNPGETKLIVKLEGKSKEGLEVIKEFTFSKDSYLIELKYIIKNLSEKTWQGNMNAQFFRGSPEEDQSSIFHVGSFTGASFSSPGKHRYQKITFKSMAKSNLNDNVKGGWVAMQQHYFLTAWIPPNSENNLFYTRAVNNNYTIGSLSPTLTVQPGEQKEIGANLYIGPEIASVLKTVAPGLDLTIDYGLLWFISSLLFSLMKAIYSFIGNWGWSIVLVTVLIKLAFYRLSAKSYKSMAGIRKLQPKLQALKERYGDDKVKISQATMELYRQEKVNPLGGCLPIVIQIPVFIALYWVLLESVELRQAPFILWIHDLAAADQYHVLPLIMGGTMLVQQQLNPAPPDPVQAKVMMFLPLLFTALFWNFPAGLVLYWIVNNALSILQQWYITRAYEDKKQK